MKMGKKEWRWRYKQKITKVEERGRKNKESVTFTGLVTPAGDFWGACSCGAVIKHADCGLWQSVCDRHHSQASEKCVLSSEVWTVTWQVNLSREITSCKHTGGEQTLNSKYCVPDRFVWQKHPFTITPEKIYNYRHARMRYTHKTCWMQTGCRKLWEG